MLTGTCCWFDWFVNKCCVFDWFVDKCCLFDWLLTGVVYLIVFLTGVVYLIVFLTGVVYLIGLLTGVVYLIGLLIGVVYLIGCCSQVLSLMLYTRDQEKQEETKDSSEEIKSPTEESTTSGEDSGDPWEGLDETATHCFRVWKIWLKSVNGRDVTKRAIIDINYDILTSIVAQLLISQPLPDLCWKFTIHSLL